MRRGGFGALLAFTVAILMFNGQSSPSTGSGNPGASSPAENASLRSAGKGGGASFEKGICELQAGKLSADYPCGLCAGFCPADDLRGTIGGFFQRSNTKQTSAEYNNDLHRHWNVPAEARAKLRFVIATAPDPTHTHLTLTFDRTITAVIEGAQREGYLLARSSMPWDTAQHPEPDTIASRLNASDWQSQKESLPGLLIFRKALPESQDEAEKVLFVFVAGESPTGGINKQQFLNALDVMAFIRAGAKEDTSNVPLLILGPSFSGSLYSLHYMLEAYPDQRPVIIHSGSASSFDTIQWFLSHPPKADVVFRSFHESDQYALQRFLVFAVCDQKYKAADFAVLAEGETAYGAVPANSRKPSTSSSPNLCDPDASEIPYFHFPRDISHLRSAYQQQIQSAAAANSGSNPSRSTLPLNLVDTGSDDDSVTIYSPGQTPLSEEAVLQGIVSSLQQHHSLFVVLQATNPLDTLFLSRYLRRAFPEGRIITMGEDTLLSREADDPRFQGILSLTSYSLLPGMDDQMPRLKGITDRSHTDLVFPWDVSAGVFNAMVALLQEPPPLPCDSAVGACQNLPAAPFVEYGWPAIGGRDCPACKILAPPLWLTVIGNNGYWPFALLDAGRGSLSDNQPASQIYPVDPSLAIFDSIHQRPAPHPWRMLCTLYLAVIILYLVLRYRGSLFAISKIAANFAPVDVSICSYGLLIIDIMFYAIFMLLLFPWRYAAFHFGGPSLWSWMYKDLHSLNFSQMWADSVVYRDSQVWSDVLWVTLAVLLFFSVVDFLKRGSYWFAVASFGFFGLFLGISFLVIPRGPSAFPNLSLYRYVHITSGVSPFVPFVILAIAGVWWGWFTLAGLVLADKRGPRLPERTDFDPKKDSPNPPAFLVRRLYPLSYQDNQKLVSVARPANPDHRVILLPLLALALSLFVINISHPVRSLEGQKFDWFYSLAFTGVLFVLLCDLFRLVIAWIELRRPLAALDHLALRRGFLRLEELKMKPIWRLGGSAFDDFYSLLGREIELLRNLAKFLAGTDSVRKAINDVDIVVDELACVVGPLRQKDKSRNWLTFYRRSQMLFASLKWDPAVDPSAGSPNWRKRIARAVDTLDLRMENEKSDKKKSDARLLYDFMRRNETSILLPRIHKLHMQLAHACAETLLFLAPRWNAEIIGPKTPPEPPEPVTEFRFQKTSLPQSTQIAEDFVCLFYFNFISAIFLRLRTLLMSVAGMFVFLVLSFNSYPFEPQTSCQTLMVFVFILIVSLVAFVLGQMSRDTTLSHITNTTPGQLGLEFWVRMISFIAIPLLSLLSAQFPQIGSFLFSWAEPALNTLK
jgi:hypothetical protein